MEKYKVTETVTSFFQEEAAFVVCPVWGRPLANAEPDHAQSSLNNNNRPTCFLFELRWHSFKIS